MARKKTNSLRSIKNSPKLDLENVKLCAPELSLLPIDEVAAKEAYQDWLESLQLRTDDSRPNTDLLDQDIVEFLSAVFSLSPYLFGLARQYPESILICHRDGFVTALQTAFFEVPKSVADFDGQDDLMKRLRVMKRKSALIAGLADLGGWWSSAKVSQTISDTADLAVQTTINYLLLDAHHREKIQLPNPQTPSQDSGLIVLAMGKHGAGELNYSSDIDLIVFFDPDAPAVLDREESVTTFVRITKAMVKVLQERTADGYVFRTDLRLRPDPGSMPLAIPLPLAMNYYESRGQNWERAALIKARPVAGDLKLGEAVLQELAPFIWRRYLDFAAISDVHSIKRQIQSHRGLTDISVPGHNLKLGRGGIREIEFFVQTQQLIAGGRNPKLRGKRTLEMLDELAWEDWIDENASDELAVSYSFLRDIEHRLQMVLDAQVHSLPDDESDLLGIARLSGFDSFDEFSDCVASHLVNVEQHYSALFEHGEELSGDAGNLVFTGDDDDPGTIDTLSLMGFENPTRTIGIIRGWHFGRYPVLQSERAREQLTAITPALLSSFQNTGRADHVLLAFDEFLEGLPAGFQLFAILKENPKLLRLLVLVLGAAPRLAKIITRRPHVFDGVLEPGFMEVVPDKEFWTEMLDRTLHQSRDYEDGLDLARIFTAEQKFLIGIRFLSGAISADEMSSLFSLLAETLLLAMVEWVGKAFKHVHGVVPGASFSVVAMGNLGSGGLTASSDLDLILLYEYDPRSDESDGGKPLHASQYFGRFAQRLIAAMSAPTGQGMMYELDFRLRPNGSDGPIATSLRAFEGHYKESAWTWERLALTRARVLGPPTDFSKRIESAIVDAIDQSGNPKKVGKDVLEMRLLMDAERKAGGPIDVKLAKGGLVDIEFLAQTSTLIDGGVNSNLFLGFNTEQQELLTNAQQTFQTVLQTTRLCLDQPNEIESAPPGLIDLLLRHLELPDLMTALAELKNTQREVRKLFLSKLKSIK